MFKSIKTLIIILCVIFYTQLPAQKINTAHLDHLYEEVAAQDDTVGIIHIYSEYPDYNMVGDDDEGIACIDDAARALVFYNELYDADNNPQIFRKVDMLTRFVLSMQAESGWFYNFIWPDYTINKTFKTSEAKPDWWTWRAMWALSEVYQLYLEKDKETAGRIKSAMDKTAAAVKSFFPKSRETKDIEGIKRPAWLPYESAADQAAVIIIALINYYKTEPDPEILEYIRAFSDGMLLMQTGSAGKYPYGAIMSWENTWHAWGAMQSYALLKASSLLKDDKYKTAALTEINYFYEYLLKENLINEFSVQLSDSGFKVKELKKFPQIAYGIRPAVYACVEAFKITNDSSYADKALRFAEWFNGKNPAGKNMYDEATGRGYDGIISADEINMNSGAESTIEALLSLIKLRTLKESDKKTGINKAPSGSLGSAYEKVMIDFNGDARVETGNNYIGIESHHNQPMLQRISFFYPSANSIDASSDYWFRDTAFINSAVLKLGGRVENFRDIKFNVKLTPYSALYYNENQNRRIEVSYKFPAKGSSVISEYRIINKGESSSAELYTYMSMPLKTSHSYKLKDKAAASFDAAQLTYTAYFDDEETMHPVIFYSAAGDKPHGYSAGDKNDLIYRKGNPFENIEYKPLRDAADAGNNPAVSFKYIKTLDQGGELNAVHIIGSDKKSSAKQTIAGLRANYESEIDQYEHAVLTKSVTEAPIITGDEWLDHSVYWSMGVLDVDQHYIDGSIEPMPCPAEYNFYFTHDVLKTDLSVINFDHQRVKDDLKFIISRADKNYVIPHAYYWKDSAYVTEPAGPDNWNNYWFVILSASYLRHTNDTAFVETLYPYINKALEQGLTNLKEDNLIWAFQPDWWDIGKKFGPRVYMTSLGIKSIRDFLYISSALNKNGSRLAQLEETAAEMKEALADKLWNNETGYLMNFYEPGKPDPHYYTGSLTAVFMDNLDKDKSIRLVNTATEKLLEPATGIFNVFPMDFNELQEYLQLQEGEAGRPYYYANGGIWPHGNAWYALSLLKTGRNTEAFDFIKKIMSVKGVMNGPNGQPAMYEYRVGKSDDPAIYGEVDKPQFMWAAGWYLYSLYHLAGVEENDWNLSFKPRQLPGIKPRFTLNTINGKTSVAIQGEGEYARSIRYDGKDIPSLVIPRLTDVNSDLVISLGRPQYPYIQDAGAVISGVNYNENEKTLKFNFNSFPGHMVTVKIISPFMPDDIKINGQKVTGEVIKLNDIYEITLTSKQKSNDDRAQLIFK